MNMTDADAATLTRNMTLAPSPARLAEREDHACPYCGAALLGGTIARAAHPAPVACAWTAESVAVGDLAVFMDYAGRDIGGRVTRIEHGLVWVKVAGLEEWQGPYRRGDVIARDARFVRGAI